MTKNVYAVKDVLTGFLDPFCMSCDRDAILAFESACRDPRCAISKSPKDYDLCVIGTFNFDSGNICSFTAEVIARGVQFVTNDYAAAMEQAINHFAESDGDTDEIV